MVYTDERFIEAEKEFIKALHSEDLEAKLYWFGYRNGVKWAIEQENRRSGNACKEVVGR